MMELTLDLTRILLGRGVREIDLIGELSGKKRENVVLRPLVVALRMRIDDDIREPREILEVARDVYREIYGQG